MTNVPIIWMDIIQAEHAFMRETIISLVDLFDRWDSMAGSEKVRFYFDMKMYIHFHFLIELRSVILRLFRCVYVCVCFLN